MIQYNFEWDPLKASSNVKKYGVTFEIAIDVFKDPFALSVCDKNYSDRREERWKTLGKCNEQYYLVVIHTDHSQHNNSVNIHIISARMATKNEIKQYETG